MNVRQSVFDLATRHQLNCAQTRELRQLAGLADEPAPLVHWLPRGVAILAAALVGLGVVMWIAANWETLGRFGRFGLLQALVLSAGLGAALRPAARVPLGLLALLGIGALFAYFGQTYQTGADPWQLFALWGALGLVLCLGARSDVLWAPWALVVMTGISLWTYTHSGHSFSVEPEQLNVHLIALSAALALVAALHPGLRRITGAGEWAFRTGVTLAVIAFTTIALDGLFDSAIAPQYPLAVLLLAVCAGVLATPRLFDVFALSAVALGLNCLLVAGLVRWMDIGHSGDWIGRLLLLGLIAAGLLSASVSVILKLSRRNTSLGESA